VASIEINGRTYGVEVVMTRNRNAYARLKGETIVVRLPSRWPKKDREKTVSSLVRRTAKEIAKGRWTPEGSRKLEFSHGQTINVMGRDFDIAFIPSERFGGRLKGDRIEVKVAEHPDMRKKASAIVCRQIVKAMKPAVLERVQHFNSLHFGAEISRLTLRDNTSTWGSCSRKGLITLNLRLLFMPEEILDYVIVHELAHTKYMSHGKRFWGLVARVLPDYEKRKGWLRDHGWGCVPHKKKGQQRLTNFLFEEVKGWNTRMRP
jgi:predicted metal-dependent hydrolase